MNEQDYIKIHKYLERELTTEESQEVANLIANNSEWKQAYAEAKLVIDTAEVHGATALRGQLDGIHQDLFGEEKEAKVVEMPRRQWLKIAASIVLPVAIGLGILFNQGNSLNQTLAANYNPLEEVNNTVRGAGDGQENPVKEALADEDWALAAELLENQAEPLTEANRKQLGVCYIELQRWADAEKQFKAIPENSVFRYSADFLLSVSYLKQDKRDAARPLLEELAQQADAGGDLRSKATELLEAID